MKVPCYMLKSPFVVSCSIPAMRHGHVLVLGLLPPVLCLTVNIESKYVLVKALTVEALLSGAFKV